MDHRIAFLPPAVLGAFLLTACNALKGEVRDGRYHSPAGNFSMPLPEGLWHTYVVDGYDEDSGYGFIEVSTDMGDLERVSYNREDEEVLESVRTVQASEGYRDFMRGYFEQEFMPQNYPARSKATVGSGPVFLPSQHGEMLFAVVRLPEGSGGFDVSSGKHYDGLRGVLLFFRDGYSYQLHKEVTGMSWTFDPSTEDARKRVFGLYNKIDFRN